MKIHSEIEQDKEVKAQSLESVEVEVGVLEDNTILWISKLCSCVSVR